jgi:hypothetical protein
VTSIADVAALSVGWVDGVLPAAMLVDDFVAVAVVVIVVFHGRGDNRTPPSAGYISRAPSHHSHQIICQLHLLDFRH